MDSDTLIIELERRATDLESEAGRLRDAANVIRGGRPVTGRSLSPSQGRVQKATDRGTSGTSTASHILAVLGESGPLGNKELTQALFEQGWETGSAAPTNTVRTALGRLMERSEVTRLEDGRFALTGFNPEDASDG